MSYYGFYLKPSIRLCRSRSVNKKNRLKFMDRVMKNNNGLKA